MESPTLERKPSPKDVGVYLQIFRETFRRQRPDLLITYGGYSLGPYILDEARRLGVKTVVTLHNLAYKDARYFENADLVLTPSQFAAQWYRERLRLKTVAVPPIILPSTRPQNETSENLQKYVLYVNPEPGKGLGVFIAIVKEMWKRLPEVKFLVVEGRAGLKELFVSGRKELSGVHNVDFISNTSEMETIYRRSKITIVPSLYQETFGRVAAESMRAGVPVIVSDRGALPEVVGDAGIVLHIPKNRRPDTFEIPDAEEIKPWVDALIRLWQNNERYEEFKRKGIEQAERWIGDSVADKYEELFKRLIYET